MTLTTTRQPAIFVSHGGGLCFWIDIPGANFDGLRDYLSGLLDRLPERFRAILVVSGQRLPIRLSRASIRARRTQPTCQPPVINSSPARRRLERPEDEAVVARPVRRSQPPRLAAAMSLSFS